MIRWRTVSAGAAMFVAAHLLVRAEWLRLGGGADVPWFLNAGWAVAATMVLFVLAGLIAGIVTTSLPDAAISGCYVSAGATLALTIVLFSIGPGTIFPIVIAVGTIAITVATLLGALAGRGLRALITTFAASR
jgi:hypothetical protein